MWPTAEKLGDSCDIDHTLLELLNVTIFQLWVLFDHQSTVPTVLHSYFACSYRGL